MRQKIIRFLTSTSTHLATHECNNLRQKLLGVQCESHNKPNLFADSLQPFWSSEIGYANPTAFLPIRIWLDVQNWSAITGIEPTYPENVLLTSHKLD
jgi:hypothetical protein